MTAAHLLAINRVIWAFAAAAWLGLALIAVGLGKPLRPGSGALLALALLGLAYSASKGRGVHRALGIAVNASALAGAAWGAYREPLGSFVDLALIAVAL